MKRRTRTKAPRWTALASTTVRDDRPGGGGREVVVTQLLDDRGRHWERWGTDDPVMVGTPPKVNEEET